mmetsp:Transcript_75605/g.162101  ORF Transcript_75605/g.162101 Transcript_75605/m.162101 type:complete len:661 (+) Transcript_75605:80-2062(+)
MTAAAGRLSPELLLLLALVFGQSPAAAWDYSRNGADWGALGICNGGAGVASAQSPIDLPAEAEAIGSDGTTDSPRQVYFKYPHLGRSVQLYNNGRSIALTMPEAYRAGFGFVSQPRELTEKGSAVYRLWQVSFHAPSEHTQRGKRMPLEMQMVHQRVTGGSELAVVSVLFGEEGSTRSPFLDAISAAGLPARAWEEVTLNTASQPASTLHGRAALNATDDLGFQALMGGSDYYVYTGSLTVPPCDAGVKHFVRRRVVPAAPSQLQTFQAVLRELCPPYGNFRDAPSFSVAGADLEVVRAVDALALRPVSATMAPSSSEDTEVSSAQRSLITENPELQEMQADDSKELRQVKTQFQQARLNYEAAFNAKSTATRELEQAKMQHASSNGALDQAELGRAVAEKTTSLNEAVLRLADARRVLDAAVADAHSVLLKERAEGARSQPWAVGSGTRAVPLEGGSYQVATTVVPYTEYGGRTGRRSPVPSNPVTETSPTADKPQVTLPHGLSASPFAVQGAAPSVVGFSDSTATPASAQSGLRLAPNLQQPDAPIGQVPEPARRPVAGAPPPEDPVEVMVRLPIALDNIGMPEKWARQFADAVADSVGVPRESIAVPKLREVSFTPIVALATASSKMAAVVAPALPSWRRGTRRGYWRRQAARGLQR